MSDRLFLISVCSVCTVHTLQVVECVQRVQQQLVAVAPELQPCLLDPVTAHMTLMVLHMPTKVSSLANMPLCCVAMSLLLFCCCQNHISHGFCEAWQYQGISEVMSCVEPDRVSSCTGVCWNWGATSSMWEGSACASIVSPAGHLFNLELVDPR